MPRLNMWLSDSMFLPPVKKLSWVKHRGQKSTRILTLDIVRIYSTLKIEKRKNLDPLKDYI